MKQIWPNYSYSPATNVLTLTGLNINRDQLLLVTAADRGRIMYNFADSSVTASAFTSGANTALTLVATTAGLTTTAALVIYYDDQLQSTSISISNLPFTQTIAGTVTANNSVLSDVLEYDGSNFFLSVGGRTAGGNTNFPINISGTVTIGAGTVTIGSLPALPAGTAQIGSVTASISGTVPISISSVTVGNSVTIGFLPLISGTVTANLFGEAVGGSANEPTKLQCDSNGFLITSLYRSGSDAVNYDPVAGNVSINVKNVSSVTIGNSVTISSLPALVAGTAQIGSVTVGNTVTISGTVTANTFALQGTAVTTSNFTSTTASTVLASYNATREVLTIFNEGAGNLHICAGATCTTIAYQVRLSAGDYYEVPNHQTTITHSAVFATAGTARVTQVS